MVTDVVQVGSVFSTVTLSEPVSVPPSASVAVTSQAMLSLGDAVLVVRVSVLDVPRVVPSVLFVHVYERIGVPPSTSVADAVQVSAVDVVTPEAGVTTTEDNTGSVFSTLTLSLPASVPPSASVTVTAQVMLSLGADEVGVRVSVVPIPRLLPVVSFVQT